ncbi:MAG: IS66 family insertion sequence element accessory protein TnpB [Verrucomicrobiota bacterium JB022]|nr:IS66 family insertion sequence element accessory protein TnpB [Verrucomicrobiota bacterium JB022]
MLNLPSQTRVFLAVEPVDLRKQFDGLWAVAQQQLGVDPFGGAFFVFRNRACNRP